MVLYHAISSYQLIEVTLHKLKNNNMHKCILLVSQDVVLRLNNYQQFNQFFDDIWVYDNGVGNYAILKGKSFNDYFDNIFYTHGSKINDFEKCYIACAHHSFGIYMVKKNIPFIFMEDGAGALSRPEVLHYVEKKRNKNKDKLALEYGLYDGSNKKIIKCIINCNSQKEGYVCQSKYEHFDIAVELEQLDCTIRAELIKIFIENLNIEINRKSVIILTEHFANLGIFSWEEQEQLYRLLVDYFLWDYELVFKPHPDDLMYYEDIFENSHVIKAKFPAEILPFLFNKRPELVATICSTSIYGVQHFFEKKLVFNYEFAHMKKQFRWLHRYYIALKGLEHISSPLYLYGVNAVIPNNFYNFGKLKVRETIVLNDFHELEKCPENSIILVDEIDEEISVASERFCHFLNISNVHIVFINSQENYVFYHIDYRDLWDHIKPIKIEKKPLISSVDEFGLPLETEQEYIFYFSKGENQMGEIISEKLEYSNVEISADFSDKDLKIKVLEGMLAASEKRLRYYIEQNKILEEKLMGEKK